MLKTSAPMYCIVLNCIVIILMTGSLNRQLPCFVKSLSRQTLHKSLQYIKVKLWLPPPESESLKQAAPLRLEVVAAALMSEVPKHMAPS